MITSEHQRALTQQRIDEFRAHIAAGAGGTSAPAILAQLEREAALWDAGIREPVPDEPQGPPADADLPVPTREEIDGMDDAAYAAYSRRVAAATKAAQIANIDRQIGILLDRIADWRRHRAWLEREIADLAATPGTAVPVGALGTTSS